MAAPQMQEKPCRALFHQFRFASDSLVAISALFLTLVTAASIPSVVLLRRLRIRRATPSWKLPRDFAAALADTE
jgi:hypothetical protein